MYPKIEQWSISSDDDGFKAPELIKYHVHGIVYGHPNFEDGTEITTNRIIEIDVEYSYLKTASREYELGEPDSEYAAWLDKNRRDKINQVD